MAEKNQKQVPVGVKAISILFYIGTILCIILGISMIFGAKAMVTSLLVSNPGMGLESIPEGLMVTLIAVIGVLAIGAGIFSFFIGKGIWKLKRWARITAIVLSIIGFLSTILSAVLNFKLNLILNFLIDGFIGGYLLFNKDAKKAFK
jgi:hypothetical protein